VAPLYRTLATEGRAPLNASTNRLLFAIVVLLFAFVLKLVTSSIDLIVFIIALAGLGIGFYGINMNEPR
jgi:hypothetical protein